MKKLVIIPGGFHPFHAGHKSLYDAARNTWPSADVYIAATGDTSDRPFPFDVKKKLARIAGVDGHRFIQVKSPFRAQEITQHYDPDTTQLIFVRSDKDREQQPQAGGVKKDGTASYLQPYRRNGLESMKEHGYLAYLPTVQFGPGMTSATEIRAKWPGMEAAEKLRLVQQLYPDTVEKTKLADVIVKMLDHVMGAQTQQPEVKEAVLVNDPDAGVQIRPEGGMGTWDERSMVSNLARKFASIVDKLKARDYKSIHAALYQDRWIQNLVRALAEYEAFQSKQGRRPIARGGEIEMSDYLDETRVSEERSHATSRVERILRMLRARHPQAKNDLEALILDFRSSQAQDRGDINRLDSENDQEEADIATLQGMIDDIKRRRSTPQDTST